MVSNEKEFGMTFVVSQNQSRAVVSGGARLGHVDSTPRARQRRRDRHPFHTCTRTTRVVVSSTVDGWPERQELLLTASLARKTKVSAAGLDSTNTQCTTRAPTPPAGRSTVLASSIAARRPAAARRSGCRGVLRRRCLAGRSRTAAGGQVGRAAAGLRWRRASVNSRLVHAII